MRSKGLLIWNTVSQLEGAYVTWVDAIALDSIGYKYYAVYMPLVIIQWFLVYFCEWFIPLFYQQPTDTDGQTWLRLRVTLSRRSLWLSIAKKISRLSTSCLRLSKNRMWRMWRRSEGARMIGSYSYKVC